MAKFCTNCGKELNDNAIACDGCGNKIEVTENNSMQKKEKNMVIIC